MSTTVSYRKKILEATHILGTTGGNVKSITFAQIAKAAGITVRQVEKEYNSMEDIFYDTGCMHIKDHNARSKKILALSGEYAMGTMLKHDLSLLIYYARDSAAENLDPVTKRVLAYVRDYIEIDMVEHYFQILIKTPSLIPNKNINAKLYSQFIVHSMFFFTKDELSSLAPEEEELTTITRQLISSLFSISSLEPKIK